MFYRTTNPTPTPQNKEKCGIIKALTIGLRHIYIVIVSQSNLCGVKQ
jgi:hypothetical protein